MAWGRLQPLRSTVAILTVAAAVTRGTPAARASVGVARVLGGARPGSRAAAG
jgi:hypothetical protein